MITVTFVDSSTQSFPTAVKQTLLRAPGAAGAAAFTGDIVLLDTADEPVAIIGAGTFKVIDLQQTDTPPA